MPAATSRWGSTRQELRGTVVGQGAQWTADMGAERMLADAGRGKVVKTISLEEAERRVERLGLPMPVRRKGKWTAGQRD